MPKRLIVPEQVAKRLIEAVKVRECLWNPAHHRYNNRYKMARAWNEIADELKISEERLRSKWKSLRDLFKKEAKKFGPVEEYTGRWRHFPALSFLRDPDTDQASEQNESERESPCETKTEVETEFYPPDNEEVYFEEAFESVEPEKKRKFSVDEDYDLMFLKSLSPYFKQLDPLRKLVVRSKMQDMLLNEIAAQSSSSQLRLSKQS